MEKLDLFDVSVHEKDWKQFKKRATQEELLVLGVGAKYRVIKQRLMSYLSALGIVLSVIIGVLLLPFSATSTVGFVVLIGGYIVFSFLATKAIRYNDTYSQIKWKLNKENKQVLKSVFKVPAFVAFIDALARYIIMWITIPYQALLILIGMVAPNFVISKNGVLLSIPKGCDIENLAEIGAYYASFSLLDEWEATSYENSHRYTGTFTNEKGVTQTVHSSDGKSFYDEGGNYVGHSEDNGKTIIEE